MATICGQLGILAHDSRDYDEAARQYQRALDIFERLGDQPNMAKSYSQLGVLEKDRGGSLTEAVTWHVRALAIWLRLGVPDAVTDLRRLAAYRRELGAEPFTRLLTRAADSTDLTETINSRLDRVDKTDGRTA